MNDPSSLKLYDNHTSVPFGTYHMTLYGYVITLFRHAFLENKNHALFISVYHHALNGAFLHIVTYSR